MLKRRAVAVALIACGLWLAASQESVTAAQAGAELPVRAVKITMAHDEHAQFVDQLSEFAAENALETRVGQPRLDPTDMLIQMRREDVKIIAAPITDPDILGVRYDIAIYINEDRPLPTAVIDQLINDLQTRVERLDSVAVAVLK